MFKLSAQFGYICESHWRAHSRYVVYHAHVGGHRGQDEHEVFRARAYQPSTTRGEVAMVVLEGRGESALLKKELVRVYPRMIHGLFLRIRLVDDE